MLEETLTQKVLEKVDICQTCQGMRRKLLKHKGRWVLVCDVPTNDNSNPDIYFGLRSEPVIEKEGTRFSTEYRKGITGINKFGVCKVKYKK